MENLSSYSHLNVELISTLSGDVSVSNLDLSNKYGEKATSQVISTIGIQNRKVFSENGIEEFFFQVSKNAFQSGKVTKDEISALVVVSQTYSIRSPGLSYILHKKLELPVSTICFDLVQGCSGYVYGLLFSTIFLSQFKKGKVLLLVGDHVTQWIDPSDKSTAFLFGDSVSATVLSYSETNQFQNWYGYETHSNKWEDLAIKANLNSAKLYMNGISVYKFAISTVPKAIQSFIKESQINWSDIDFFISHQANKHIVDQISKILSIKDPAVILNNSENDGNTSGSSIPLSITRFCESQSIDFFTGRALLCGFGIGMSLGIVYIKFNNTLVLKNISYSKRSE